VHPRISALLDGWKKYHMDVSNFLIVGGDLPSREELANALTRYLLCVDECGKCSHCHKYQKNVHPDVFVVGRTSASIKIEQIRILRQEIRGGPYAAPYRIIQIPEADTLTPEASSALLKSAEEAPHHTIFIFMAKASESLPATLVSRCQKILLPEMFPQTTSTTPTRDHLWLEQDLVARYQSLEKMGESKNAVPELQEFVEGLYFSLRSGNAPALPYLKRALHTERRLAFHVNAPLVLTAMMFDQDVDE
jgi:hypothetical protein